MARYAAKFTKQGYIKYISHLDMMRLFERLFKRTGIKLKYSNGYNPHPKIAFASPLSLGYESLGEVVEFETVKDYLPSELMKTMNENLAEGIRITAVKGDIEGKSLASRCVSAEYIAYLPKSDLNQDVISSYLSQPEITALKKQKKTKKLVEVDIKDRILGLKGDNIDDKFVMTIKCDMRSDSSLSPELVIQSFISFAAPEIRREDIEVVRTNIEISDFSF